MHSGFRIVLLNDGQCNFLPAQLGSFGREEVIRDRPKLVRLRESDEGGRC